MDRFRVYNSLFRIRRTRGHTLEIRDRHRGAAFHRGRHPERPATIPEFLGRATHAIVGTFVVPQERHPIVLAVGGLEADDRLRREGGGDHTFERERDPFGLDLLVQFDGEADRTGISKTKTKGPASGFPASAGPSCTGTSRRKQCAWPGSTPSGASKVVCARSRFGRRLPGRSPGR